MAHNFLMFDAAEVDDDPFGIGGTSAATPQIAGMIGILNAVSLTLSGKVLGFVNQLLYQAWASGPTTNFNDITSGDNTCRDNGCLKGCSGFFATAGWDAVTGLGSFNHENLVTYLTKLNAERAAKWPQKYQNLKKF